MTAAAILLTAIAAITAGIVLGLFLWAAREDGRDQKRRDAGRGGTFRVTRRP
jgi:hypothetical protein